MRKRHLELTRVGSTTLRALTEKKTEYCFRGVEWIYCDRDFREFLPAKQKKTPSCTVTTFALSQDATFAQMASAVLKAPSETPFADLAKLLIARKHTMTLTQGERTVDAAERGEPTGLQMREVGNFCFVENADPEHPIGVCLLLRSYRRRWSAYLGEFNDGHHWDTHFRLLVPNVSSAKF